MSNMRRRNETGTRGRGRPRDTSHNRYTNVGKSKFVVFPARICVAVVSLQHSKEIELKLHD